MSQVALGRGHPEARLWYGGECILIMGYLKVVKVVRRPLSVVVALLGLGIILNSVADPAGAQAVAAVRLEPSSLEVREGAKSTLSVKVEDVEDLAGAEVHLVFDPRMLAVVDANPEEDGIQIAHGDFLSPDFVVQNAADQTSGKIDYAIACMPLDKSVTGGGTLARVTIEALATGESEVSIESALLADSRSQPIGVELGSSTVSIGSGRAPTGLLAGGLAVAVAAVGSLMLVRRSRKVR